PAAALARDRGHVGAAPKPRAERLGAGDHRIGAAQRIDLALARAPFGGDRRLADAGLHTVQFVAADQLGLDAAALLQRDLGLEEVDVALALAQHQPAGDPDLEILTRIALDLLPQLHRRGAERQRLGRAIAG